MTFAQTFATALERSNQLQTYWSFYATVVLGVLAFFGSAKAGNRSTLVAGLVSIGFVAVSIANLEALIDVSRQRLALQATLVQLAGEAPTLLSLVRTLTPSTLFSVRAFHYTFDIFTLAAIWTLTLRPKQSPVDLIDRSAT